MPRLKDEDGLTRFHAVLYQEDLDLLKTLYGKSKMSLMIRKILHKYLKALRARAMQKVGAKPITVDDLLDLEGGDE